MSLVDLDSSYSHLVVGHEAVREFLLGPVIVNAVEFIGHNVFNYDLKVLEKLYNWIPAPFQKIHDTMILGQLLYADLKNMEDSDEFPGKIFSKRDTGSHSLRAWGQRIKTYKGEYSGGWESYNDDMGRYCIGDTYTTKSLYNFFESKWQDKLLSKQAMDLEYAIAPILARQQAYGVLFDKEKADNLILALTHSLVESRLKLRDVFKPRFVSLGEFIPKRNMTYCYESPYGVIKHEVKKEQIFSKIKLEEFNPSSRTQIIDRLIKEFGWNPDEFTEKGNAKMDEDIIENLPFKELGPLKEYLTITKRISQIETGKQAWIIKIDIDSRIRGAIRQNGAVTGRMAHFSPNMAQIPANDSLYGKECRELFIVPKNKVMIGCDADALEMRCLAGYLTPIDSGRFMQSLLTGKKEDGTDPHSINAEAMGIDREPAKTVFYAFIYGARNAKIGKILLESGIDFSTYVEDFEKNVKGMLEWVAKKNEEAKRIGKEPMERTEMYWKCWVAGKECLKRFGDRIPELPQLQEKIKARIKEKGYIKGLDGRKLFCRSEHGALNTVLQSAGAIIMKQALAIADTDLQLSGLRPGIDYEFILNVRDEWQLEVTNDQIIVDKVREILENSIKKAGEFFNFPCPQKGNSAVGLNWSLTH